ncbi:MAG: hypothetical protein WCR85_00210 [Sphaerochaeta sp.]
MDCNDCDQITHSVPAGALNKFGKFLGEQARNLVGRSGSITGRVENPLLEMGAKQVPRVNLTRAVPDVIHQGVRHGTVPSAPLPVNKYLRPEQFKSELDSIYRHSVQESQRRLARMASAPTPSKLHPKLANVPAPDALRILQKRSDDLLKQPIIITPEKAIGKPFAFKPPEAVARMYGSAGATKALADKIARSTADSGRALSKTEIDAISIAMRELDDAGAKFAKEAAIDPAVLSRQIKSQADVLVKDSPVSAAMRQTDDVATSAIRTVDEPGVSALRASDDAGDVLSHSDYANLRPLAGDTFAGERVVMDEFGRPLMQKTFNTADGGVHHVYRELTERESQQWARQVTREVSDVGDDVLRNQINSMGSGAKSAFGKSTSIYKTAAVVGGAAITGGVVAKMMLSPADALPLGDDLGAYQEAVCDPEGQYYDEISCAMVSQVNELLKTYPTTWEEVCVEGSPIYDPNVCQAVQGMVAAAQAGVPYQGGAPEDYGGKSQEVNQETIDQMVSQYCHPASPSYSPDACAQVKAIADKYGFKVNDPQGSEGEGENQPPWEEMTVEEIHATICDKYGKWYDKDLCQQYTDYIKEQNAGGSQEGASEGTDGGYAGGEYIEGSGDYASAGSVTDGGWYGGGNGGVQYYEDETPEAVCALDDSVCMGWFQYGGEWFYWDGEEFYDYYGNLTYFVWTAEDEAEYEAALAQMYPDGGVDGDVDVEFGSGGLY